MHVSRRRTIQRDKTRTNRYDEQNRKFFQDGSNKITLARLEGESLFSFYRFSFSRLGLFSFWDCESIFSLLAFIIAH